MADQQLVNVKHTESRIQYSAIRERGDLNTPGWVSDTFGHYTKDGWLEFSFEGVSLAVYSGRITLFNSRYSSNNTWRCLIDGKIIESIPRSVFDGKPKVICEWKDSEGGETSHDFALVVDRVDMISSYAEFAYLEYLVDNTQPQPTTPPQSPPGSPSRDGKQTSTPVAAIAGGVVGGVVLVALLALAAVFHSRRRKQKQVSRAVVIDDELPKEGNAAGSSPASNTPYVIRSQSEANNTTFPQILASEGQVLGLGTSDLSPSSSQRPKGPSRPLPSSSLMQPSSVSPASGRAAGPETLAELENTSRKGQVVTEWDSSASGTHSRVVIHEDSGIRTTPVPVVGEEIIELPPAYTPN